MPHIEGMKVTARVMNGDDHEVELPEDATYARLLDEIGENPEAAVVVVDGRPVPEDARIDDEVREVKVMRTISGGRGRRMRTVSGGRGRR